MLPACSAHPAAPTGSSARSTGLDKKNKRLNTTMSTRCGCFSFGLTPLSPNAPCCCLVAATCSKRRAANGAWCTYTAVPAASPRKARSPAGKNHQNSLIRSLGPLYTTNKAHAIRTWNGYKSGHTGARAHGRRCRFASLPHVSRGAVDASLTRRHSSPHRVGKCPFNMSKIKDKRKTRPPLPLVRA